MTEHRQASQKSAISQPLTRRPSDQLLTLGAGYLPGSRLVPSASQRTVSQFQGTETSGRSAVQRYQPARAMYDAGGHTVQQIANTFQVSRPTIYRHLAEQAA